MKRRTKIIILFIIMISVITFVFGIFGTKEDDTPNASEDKGLSTDVKAEEFEDEVIIVPSVQGKIEEEDKGSSTNETEESDENEGTPQGVQDEHSDSGSKTEENQIEQGIELGENELPFVPAE